MIYFRQRVLFLHDEGGVIAVGSEKGARDEAKSEFSQYNITLDRQYNHQYSHKIEKRGEYALCPKQLKTIELRLIKQTHGLQLSCSGMKILLFLEWIYPKQRPLSLYRLLFS